MRNRYSLEATVDVYLGGTTVTDPQRMKQDTLANMMTWVGLAGMGLDARIGKL